eukprot:EG_transcript_43538
MPRKRPSGPGLSPSQKVQLPYKQTSQDCHQWGQWPEKSNWNPARKPQKSNLKGGKCQRMCVTYAMPVALQSARSGRIIIWDYHCGQGSSDRWSQAQAQNTP